MNKSDEIQFSVGSERGEGSERQSGRNMAEDVRKEVWRTRQMFKEEL